MAGSGGTGRRSAHQTRRRAEYRRYRGTECANCPLKEKCTKSDSRTVKRYEGDDLKDAMAQVMRQPQAKERFRRRSQGERNVSTGLRQSGDEFYEVLGTG